MKILFFIFSMAIASVSVADGFARIEALGGKVSILTPEGFGPMSNELIELKFPHTRRPTEVLSDDTGGVTLVFNHTNDLMQPGQLNAAHKSMSKMFHSLYPSAEWIRDEVIEQNGSVFIVLELITPAIDTEIHNIIYGTSVDGRFLLSAFNTTVEQSREWLPIGKEIMSSLQIK